MADNGDTAPDTAKPKRRGRGRGIKGERVPTELDRRVGTWVRHNREAVGISMRDLAAQLTARHLASPWQESRVKRVELAESRLTYDDVHAILDALDVPPRLFYQQAGIVTLPDTLEEAILSDPHLDARDRRRLAGSYRTFRDNADAPVD